MKSKPMRYAERIAYCDNPVSKRLLSIIEEKQTNLTLSADVTQKTELLMLAETLGPEICVLKTHIDIIEDFDEDLIQTLRALAKKHQFILFEDRKFADIGSTVQKQYGKGIYHIADWADLVNAHTLPGPGIIEGLKNIGLPKQRALLLLAEMSSAGHLLSETYQQATLKMAQAHADFVIGFISQRKLLEEPCFLYLTPGVQLQAGGDALGQQYNTPETAILKNQSDIIIVGRGIYAAADPVAEAKKYRRAGWDAYLARLSD